MPLQTTTTRPQPAPPSDVPVLDLSRPEAGFRVGPGTVQPAKPCDGERDRLSDLAPPPPQHKGAATRA